MADVVKEKWFLAHLGGHFGSEKNIQPPPPPTIPQFAAETLWALGPPVLEIPPSWVLNKKATLPNIRNAHQGM